MSAKSHPYLVPPPAGYPQNIEELLAEEDIPSEVETRDADESTGALRGLFYGTLLSLPIWAGLGYLIYCCVHAGGR